MRPPTDILHDDYLLSDDFLIYVYPAPSFALDARDILVFSPFRTATYSSKAKVSEGGEVAA